MLKRQVVVVVVDLVRPAAFRRLCVETYDHKSPCARILPAAFRRLCVETFARFFFRFCFAASRLQAAVC